MPNLIIDLPQPLHTKLRELAKREGVSMNQLITQALAEKISALETKAYLQERAQRGDRSRFAAALDKVPDTEPVEEADHL